MSNIHQSELKKLLSEASSVSLDQYAARNRKHICVTFYYIVLFLSKKPKDTWYSATHIQEFINNEIRKQIKKTVKNPLGHFSQLYTYALKNRKMPGISNTENFRDNYLNILDRDPLEAYSGKTYSYKIKTSYYEDIKRIIFEASTSSETNSPKSVSKLKINPKPTEDRSAQPKKITPELRDFQTQERAVDCIDLEPAIRAYTTRIIRDTEISRRVKQMHNNQCQICGKGVPLQKGWLYVEAHHIRPLGKPHDGPDIPQNIICVCPYHHVQLDYGFLVLDIKTLKKSEGHIISQEFIDYHNKTIFPSRK